ncbi:MAG: iron-sulfur cluster assembly accessory protein [Gammaproteobacteria bacterium]|jgi:iron-sulfur cluster assembly protein
MAVALTENAAARVKAMLQQRGNGFGLRLATRKSGCSGFMYVVDYADDIEDSDTVFESHGVKVVIDKQSLSQLDGTTVDYVRTNALHEGFEFSNPNVKDMCGCGESFRI